MTKSRSPRLSSPGGLGWVRPRSWLAVLLAAALPVGLALAAGEEEDDTSIGAGSCQFARDYLAGPVLRTKNYDPPLGTNCAIYTRKLVVWDTAEKERYFGYVMPDTVCTVNGDPVGCGQIRKNDEVETVFERKVSTELRGKLLEVHATRS